MTEKPITHFEHAQAALSVETMWNAARASSGARDQLVALEMIIQGLAYLRGVDPEALRNDMAAWSSGIGLDEALRSMPARGSA